MRVVVDTNIAFSAILNTNSKISRIILLPKSKLNFYSTGQLDQELIDNWQKLKKISNLSETELRKVVSLITTKIKFINVELIPVKLYLKAQSLTADVDIDDTEFVALTEHISGKLWSGDNQLIKGLKRKKWDKFITTEKLFKSIRNDKS